MKKLRIETGFSEEKLDNRRFYSFINFSSVGNFLENKGQEDLHYYCDGFLTAIFFSIACRKKVARVSFDFTSIADSVFRHAENQNKGIYIVGAKQDELELFIKKIRNLYPQIRISGHRNGYFSGVDEEDVIESIIESKASLLIAGLGAGKQESFLLRAKKLGFEGVAFTCGGFIRQESMKAGENYYPPLINKLNLRAFYRMYKEPHTIKRYLFEYPANIFKLSKLIISSRVQAITPQ